MNDGKIVGPSSFVWKILKVGKESRSRGDRRYLFLSSISREEDIINM